MSLPCLSVRCVCMQYGKVLHNAANTLAAAGPAALARAPARVAGDTDPHWPIILQTREALIRECQEYGYTQLRQYVIFTGFNDRQTRSDMTRRVVGGW